MQRFLKIERSSHIVQVEVKENLEEKLLCSMDGRVQSAN